MRFIGIDIAAETHVVAIIDDVGDVLLRPTAFAEDREGYTQLQRLIGSKENTLVVIEATGHYWKNLFVFLKDHGFEVAVINPLSSRRFAEANLRRTKTDSIDAVVLAQFGAQMRPSPTALPAETSAELQALSRLHGRLGQDLGDRTRQLHRAVKLAFPEFTKAVKDLSAPLATTLLKRFPTAKSFREADEKAVADLKVGEKPVGSALAKTLIDAAATSVGSEGGRACQLEVRLFCEGIEKLRKDMDEVQEELNRLLRGNEVAQLLQTIPGVGALTAARLMGSFGEFEGWKSGKALGSYVGAIPGLQHSGKKKPNGAMTRLGAAALRAKLWTPTVVAVRFNPVLKRFYEGLLAKGKSKKEALIACMRKLLLVVYSVVKNRKPFFDPAASQVSKEVTP